MSFFSFDRGNANTDGNFWNYGNPEKDGYSPMLMGRVVELSDPCATKYMSNEIDRWDDGNAKRNIRMAIVDGAGNEFLWDFGPGSKKNPSRAMQACAAALAEANIQANGLEDMLGMVISVSTNEPPQGFKYGAGAPRPWEVHIIDPNKGEHRGTKHIPDPREVGAQAPAAAQVTQAPAPMPSQLQNAVQNAANAMGFQQQQPQMNQGYFANQVPTEAYGV